MRHQGSKKEWGSTLGLTLFLTMRNSQPRNASDATALRPAFAESAPEQAPSVAYASHQPAFIASGTYQIGNAAGFRRQLKYAKREQFRSETTSWKLALRWPVRIASELRRERTSRTDCAKSVERNFRHDQNEREKTRIAPAIPKRNPRSQSHLNLENSLNAACAWPVSSWPLSWVSWLPSSASPSSGPVPS